MKDLKDRQRILEKLKKNIGKQSNPKKLITNQGAKKFVSVNDEETVTLDEDKIEMAAQWDGLHGIITNIRDEAIYRDKRTKDRYRVPGTYSNNARKIYKAFELERSLDASIYIQ